MAALIASDYLALVVGVTFLAVGVLVLLVKPRQRQNVFFAAFAFLFGANRLIVPIAWGIDASLAYASLSDYLLLATNLFADVALFAVVVALVPRWRLRSVPVVATLSLGALVGLASGLWSDFGLLAEADSVHDPIRFFSNLADFAVYYGALFGLLWRSHPSRLIALGDAKTPAFLSMVMMSFLAVHSGAHVTDYARAISQAASAQVWASFAVLLVLPVLGVGWIVQSRLFPRPSGRALVVSGLFTLVLFTYGAVRGAFGPRTLELSLASDVMGIVALLALAYGILAHNVLGLDVKVRFAVKGSTLAAAFIGVFFMVSEGAQAFFGAQAGNEYYGIAGAGALVFALAPLQRLADRVAQAAVPAPASGSGNPSEDAYRKALRIAMRDRRLTAEEETHLAELADALGLKASQAVRIRLELRQRP